ncbi:HAD family hydrolase [Rhodococcus globerulus]|uniref:HAD hydrolase-like protein n=1 Tax=Rhodococcus globerulus TaxID=33008 RepID=A0ABU4C2T3_RHOGO|nr:HAD hydrolase-like protein [Rhodococcus globerulus]MDV6270809.1 HAD hydrolase-like protein [Rhodococcus globerulus]
MTHDIRQFATIAVDWNGTIVDDVDRAFHATVTSLNGIGLIRLAPADLDQFRTAFTLPMEAFFAGLEVPDKLIDNCITRWNTAMMTIPATLAPGAQKLLRGARDAGVPVIVISGAHEDVIKRDSEKLGISTLIDHIYGGVHPKRNILRRYAMKGPIAYFGDTIYDVEEGIAAGATTIAVDFGYGKRESFTSVTPIVSNLSDVFLL